MKELAKAVDDAGFLRAWRIWRRWHWPTATYLLLGACFVFVYFSVLTQPAQDLAYQIPEMVGPIAIVLGVRVHRPRQRTPWFLLAAWIAASAVGDWMWVLLESLGVAPFPSVADIFYLSGMILLALGVVGLLRGRIPGGDRAGLTDAAVVAVGAALLSWTFVMQPQVSDPDASLFEIAVALAYPILDVLLLAILVRLFLAPGRRGPALRLLLLSLAALLAADFPFAVMALSDSYQVGNVIDLGWLAAPILAAAAAIHPSMRRVAEPAARQEVQLSRMRLAILAAASLMAPAVLVIQWLLHDSIDVPVIALGCVVLFLLVISRLVGALRDLRRTLVERDALAIELQRRALTDPLTGLANSRLFYERLDTAVAAADRSVAVFFLDLDNFKTVNDTFGHQTGDEVLRHVAVRLRAAVRDSDTVARIGGDEFAIVMDGGATRDVATGVARRILRTLPEPMATGDWMRSIGVSVGIAVADGADDVDAQELLRRADSAMYDAKRAGKASFTVFGDDPVRDDLGPLDAPRSLQPAAN